MSLNDASLATRQMIRHKIGRISCINDSYSRMANKREGAFNNFLIVIINLQTMNLIRTEKSALEFKKTRSIINFKIKILSISSIEKALMIGNI